MRLFLLLILFQTSMEVFAQNTRPRSLGIYFGALPTGQNNAITDVPGIRVGHTTIVQGDSVRTGVTAILPHLGNLFNRKTPAAVYVGNGYGKLAGTTQIEELGNIETPILLTNTLSVGKGLNSLITYTLQEAKDNKNIRSVNGVVGETNDGYLNNISARFLEEKHFLQAISLAHSGVVEEGNVGAGTGTICFGYKGGIGTSSRKIKIGDSIFHIGVLVQSNFGGQLRIGGLPIDQILTSQSPNSSDGSCMIVVATDAPVLSRNLKRLAKRAMLGLARTGGIASNGSGDYVISFSNYQQNLLERENIHHFHELENNRMSILFQACIEATEEAIINSLFLSESMEGYKGRKVKSLPIDRVLDGLGSKGLLIKLPKKNNGNK